MVIYVLCKVDNKKINESIKWKVYFFYAIVWELHKISFLPPNATSFLHLLRSILHHFSPFIIVFWSILWCLQFCPAISSMSGDLFIIQFHWLQEKKKKCWNYKVKSTTFPIFFCLCRCHKVFALLKLLLLHEVSVCLQEVNCLHQINTSNNATTVNDDCDSCL